MNVLFMGKEVLKPCELKEKYLEYDILILSSNYYKEIYFECISMEIAIWLPFVSDELQTVFEKYSIYPNPPIYLNEEKRVSESGIKNCDVWIHQDIRKDNAWGYYFSDEYLRQYVRPDVKEIVVPNLFGLGKFLFPQTGLSENLRDRKINKYGADVISMFPWTDSIIDKCMEDGMDKREIEEFCKGGGHP